MLRRDSPEKRRSIVFSRSLLRQREGKYFARRNDE
jgi:hypothetical protein